MISMVSDGPDAAFEPAYDAEIVFQECIKNEQFLLACAIAADVSGRLIRHLLRRALCFPDTPSSFSLCKSLQKADGAGWKFTDAKN
jgi:hypothetical protein